MPEPTVDEVRAMPLDGIRKLRFLPQGWTQADSQAVLPLPDGWRWLTPGEQVVPGDVMHDPRGEPTELRASWLHTDKHHPTRRNDVLAKRSRANYLPAPHYFNLNQAGRYRRLT